MNDLTGCPIDFVKVNESRPRLVAALVVLLSFAFCLTQWRLLMLFLSIDFFLRAFKMGKYSVLGNVAKFLIQQFQIGGKPVDEAPKRFAAKLGFIFTIAILALSVAGYAMAATIATCVLILFAVLESAFSFCVGCKVYAVGLRMKIFK